MTATATQGTRTVAGRGAAVGAFALGVLIVVPPEAYRARQEIGTGFNLIDGSYQLEMPMRLASGEWAGRDFVFTGGPLFQVLHGAGLLVPPGGLASVLRFAQVAEDALVLLCVWGLLAMTGAPLSWRAPAFWLWAVFWPTGPTVGLSPMGGLVLVAAGARLLASRRWGLRWAVWGGSAPLLTLNKFDLGLLTLVALLATAAAVFAVAAATPGEEAARVRRRSAGAAVAAVGGFGLFAAALRASGGWSSYLGDSWDLAMGYTRTMSLPLSDNGLAMLAATLLAAAAFALGAAYGLRRSWRAGVGDPRRALALLGASALAGAFVRYGLTRSYWTSVRFAMSPTLFLAAAWLPCALRASGRGRAARLTLLCWIPAAWLTTIGPPWVVAAGLPARLRAVSGFDPSPARLEVSHPLVARAAAAVADRPGDSLYVWPYETIVGLVAGRRNPDVALQSYSDHTERLERATIARIASRPDLPVVIVTNSPPIDGVENLTRTPHIFRHLLGRFELDGPRRDGFLLLRRRPSGASPWVEEPLAVPPSRFAPGAGRSLVVDLPPAADVRASDLLWLRLRAAETPLRGLFKPGDLTITFVLADGRRRAQRLLLAADGEPHATLAGASTLRDPMFALAFHPEFTWRSRERLAAFELSWRPLDRLSRRPAWIALEGVSLLRRPATPALESSAR